MTPSPPRLTDAGPGTSVAWQEAVDEPLSERLLDDREREVRDAVRRIVAAEVAPRALGLDRTHAFAEDGYQALAGAGLAGLLFPTELGGSGDSTVAYAAAMEELTAACPSTSMIYMTQTHAAYPIWLAARPEVATAIVPQLVDGRAYGSLGITEPNAGSDVSSLRTTAREVQDGWQLSGSKTFITTGDRADVIVCFATTDRSAGRSGVTAFVVDGNADGVEHGRPLDKMGLHASSTAELFLDDVHVPTAHRLGELGGGWDVLLSSVVKSRISAAAQGVGIARGAYVRTLALLQERHGGRLPQEVAFALAELRGAILEGRLLLLTTAREVDRALDPPTADIAVMKQRCTDLGFRAALAAVRLLGPVGDLADTGVERYVRDAKAAQIYDGTNEIQRLLVARDTHRRTEELRP
jgi:alkylation response protein AidB-like acyl-CoA dehydrogenase